MTQSITKKVLKSSDYVDILNAKETLFRAETLARKTISEAEAIRQSAYKTGYQQGLQQAQFDNVEHTVNLVSESIDYLGRLEKEIANIVFSSIRKIIASYQPDDLAIQSIKLGVKEVSNSKQILLRAAPDLAKTLFNRISEIDDNHSHINLVTDNRLEDNQCTIESDLGIIHVNVNDMVDKLQQLINLHINVTSKINNITK